MIRAPDHIHLNRWGMTVVLCGKKEFLSVLKGTFKSVCDR